MEIIKIYFLKNIEARADNNLISRLQKMVIEHHSRNQSGYLIEAKKTVESDPAIKDLLSKLLPSDSLKFAEFTYTIDINLAQQPAGSEWFGNTGGGFNFTYKIKIAAKTITYNCIKVVDENNFLCYAPEDKEIFVAKKNLSDKAFVA